jgi:hypothetical protein
MKRNLQDETNEDPDSRVFLVVGLVNMTFISTQIPEDSNFFFWYVRSIFSAPDLERGFKFSTFVYIGKSHTLARSLKQITKKIEF